MGPNNIWSKTTMRPNKIRVQKSFGSTKNIVLIPNNVGSKKNCDAKNVGSKEIICPKISLISNYFSLKKNVAQKVLVPRIESAKNCGF